MAVRPISVIVAAAGTGRRLAGTAAKQYLPIAGRTVLEWSLAPFLARSDIASIVIVTASGDERWRELDFAGDRRVRAVPGAAERAGSVLCGLEALEAAQPADWVLVHDAARPCLADEDLDHLIETLRDEPIGGLLATPLGDTLKRATADDRVLETVAREALWRALTPQMFRYEPLRSCLARALERGVTVTDEAAALEQAGHRPRLVRGRADNVKVTLPEDLTIAAAILNARKLTR